MATSTALGYNTGSTITGTQKIGNLAVVTGSTANPSSSPNGVKFWMGPDEDLGYVVGLPISGGTQSTPTGVNAFLGFIRSQQLTSSSFLTMVNSTFNQSFTTGSSAKTYLNDNGYWTSFSGGGFPEVGYLVVGGGGSTAQNNASEGGGGAGGFVTGTTTLDLSTNYTITVGAGGARRTGTNVALPGFSGNLSSISATTVLAVAQGGGPTADGIVSGGAGASGGGGVVFSSSAAAGGTGIVGEGKNGGNGCTEAVCTIRASGGGGGAGTVGVSGASNKAGNGGNGLQWIDGVYYAGGGGGNSYGAAGTNGTGGLGGGGNGSVGTAAGGTDGTANRGGGSGGGSGAATSQAAGGSGIVIIGYVGTVAEATGGVITFAGGYVIHTFTGSGTFTT